MSTLEDNYSENEDDPKVYESSGDEWSSASEVMPVMLPSYIPLKIIVTFQKKRTSRRASQRLSKKPRVTHIESSDSESDSPKSKSRNGVKRQKVTNTKSAGSATKRSVNNAAQSLPDFGVCII